MFFDVRAAKLLKPGEHLAVEGCEGLRLVASASKQTWAYRYKSPATGLIEAEIAPALDGSGKYKNARNAIVTRITKEGIAEINRMRTEESRSKLARRL